MRRLVWILAGAALVAVLAIGISQSGGDESEPAATSGATLDRSLAELEGAPAPLAELHERANVISSADTKAYEEELRKLRGYPVVVNAWASWCGPCKLEFPIFRDVATKLGKEVAFLGLDVSDNREDAGAFLAKQPVPYPHLEDGDGRIVQKAGASGGLPTTIFYDADGTRAYIHQGGYTKASDLVGDIERYAR